MSFSKFQCRLFLLIANCFASSIAKACAFFAFRLGDRLSCEDVTSESNGCKALGSGYGLYGCIALCARSWTGLFVEVVAGVTDDDKVVLGQGIVL